MTVPESPMTVSAENLSALSDHMQVPRYDRRALSPAIVHIGVGGFNRAHQAVYLDDVLSAPERQDAMGDGTRWGECGLGLLSSDRRMQEVLRAQDFLYTVVERSPTERKARVIGSICDYIFAPDSPEEAIAKMTSPECRIVSMTITEAGYFIDQGSGKFEEDHPDVRFDLENPGTPRSFVGLICAALDRRRVTGLPPFTVLSCDNLQGNGDVARSVLRSFAELRDPGLARWMERNVTFPNSMVDRITPATTETERKLVEERFAVRDAWPVITEPFRQWVMEDDFCNGRPAWERVGVLMTGEVTPFEEMKMRLLNGSHFAMAYMGAMRRFEFIHEILEDSLMRRFVVRYMEAVLPAVPEVPGIDLTKYKATLIERFSNSLIRDQVARVCAEGSSKLPKFILPVFGKLMEAGADTGLVSLVVASWLHFFRRRDERGEPIAVVDACAAEITRAVESHGADPSAALAISSIFGEELPANPRFVAEVQNAMKSLLQNGVVDTLERYLAT